MQTNTNGRERFSKRINFFENPAIAEKLERLATSSGHSLAAEIRQALRFWISAWGSEDADDD
jgi:hypothetical protein